MTKRNKDTSTVALAREFQCDLRGRTCYEGWLAIKWNHNKRCPNKAEYISSGGTKVCAQCLKHRREVCRAKIAVAKRELAACKSCKVLK